MNDSKIKIFVDCHVFDYGFQGTRTYIQGLYLEFTKNKNYTFYLASNKTEILKSIFGESQNIVYLKYKSNNKLVRILIEIPTIISHHKIDFAHFQYIVPPIKKCKYIVTTHDVLFLDFPEFFPILNRIKNNFLYKQSANLADIRLTVSNYSKAKIEKHYKLKNFLVTPNAVSDVFFESYNKQEIQEEVLNKYNIKNHIVYISRWEPRKNHDLVLRAFVDLKLYHTHQLIFVGDTTFKNEIYETLYKSLESNITSQIKSFKKIDFNAMISFLRSAKAFVYPTVAEGFGIPPLEAIAAKIPTLCSNKTAMADFEFFEEFLFDPTNEEEFKFKLSTLLHTNNTERVLDISKKIKSKYSWKKSALVLENAIATSNITDF